MRPSHHPSPAELGGMASGTTSMTDVAQALRRARKKRRVSIAQAAEDTRIAPQYLRALEEDAPIDAFPAPVYARFFLREYAQFLGVEDEPLVAAFASRHGADEEVILEEVAAEEVPPPSKRPAKLLAAMSIVVLLITAAAALTAGGQKVPSTPLAAPPANVGKPPSASALAATARVHRLASRRPHLGLRAVLDVKAPCWVQATADGRILLRRTLRAGTSVTLRARRTLWLVLGNGGGTRLLVNGRAVPTGLPNRVVHIGLAWRHGRVVTV